ncbi:hypothetical protein J1N35_022209 [Gossypium stocksii]|uniref:Uncharacterized protein n=1 Tax=Gossypium stocksii TaxID=47602 RepID=A0A9D4A220_9ROSI|nr:hypothetical protein J1N35_022209 [Gossypium stocksii]
MLYNCLDLLPLSDLQKLICSSCLQSSSIHSPLKLTGYCLDQKKWILSFKLGFSSSGIIPIPWTNGLSMNIQSNVVLDANEPFESLSQWIVNAFQEKQLNSAYPYHKPLNGW